MSVVCAIVSCMRSNVAELETRTTSVSGHEVVYDAGGSGAPVLLLHGFPQTRLTWRMVAPRLVGRCAVVCPDLPGYGLSERLGDGPESFDKSLVAAHMIELMRSLGHDRFAVIGHDRGALVAFRMALDHPGAVTHLGVLDVIEGRSRAAVRPVCSDQPRRSTEHGPSPLD